MGKETEYKLEVGDLQLLDCILCSEPVASRMQAPFAYIRMQTTYYDTEDGLLEKNRWMLRLRTEHERSAGAMQAPGEGPTRRGGKKELLCELELELQAGEEADVQAFAKTLAERFHLHEQPRSKLQRARALTQ